MGIRDWPIFNIGKRRKEKEEELKRQVDEVAEQFNKALQAIQGIPLSELTVGDLVAFLMSWTISYKDYGGLLTLELRAKTMDTVLAAVTKRRESKQ